MSTESVETELTQTENPFLYATVPYENYEDFGETHGVYSGFLPFAHRTGDPIEVLMALGEFLDSRLPTVQRVSMSYTQTKLPVEWSGSDRHHQDAYFLIHGWVMGGRTTSGRYYCNPEYVHSHGEDTIGDVERRIEVILDAAAYGVRAPTLAPIFGCNPRNVRRAAQTHVTHDWEGLYKQGLTKMARTAKVAHAWTDYTHEEIGRAFGLSAAGMKNRINRHAQDFEPPADPTVGFTRGGGQ